MTHARTGAVGLAALALAGCGASFATRYATGNQALSSSEGAMYFVVMAPILQQELNRCIPMGLAGAAPTLVLVADVGPDGRASAVDLEPDSPGTDCLRDALSDRRLPRPPLASGQVSFPIGLKIDSR